MSDVVLRGIRKAYGEIQTIHGVDLDIRDGEFIVFVGPSGCGKSTLLRMIAGLEDITQGEMLIGGERVNDTPPAKRGVAMVFQSYALYPHMSVYDNMAFGLKLAGVGQNETRTAVERAAKILQIEHLLDRKPKALSGGQRQRVAIGRAIVRKPNVFLFDEPLSNLDAALRVQMRIEITKLHRELATTMIYVTHDQVEAMTLADRIVVLQAGKVEQVGAPLELYHHPANLFVAGFIGSPKMNFVDARISAVEQRGITVQLSDGSSVTAAVESAGASVGAKVTLGIRPEHFCFDTEDATNRISGCVMAVEQLGEATYLYLEVQGAADMLVVRADAAHPARRGEAVQLRLPAERCYLFNETGLAYQRRAAVALSK